MSFRTVTLAAAASLLLASTAAQATLAVGAKAPEIVTKGALAGKPFDLKLSQQLKQGPCRPLFLPGGVHPRLHAGGA